MPSVEAVVEIAADARLVYQYLHDRYDGEAYIAASLASKGYVPRVKRLESVDGRRLVFRVAGRDALTKIPTSSWKWSYEVEGIGEARSRVTIRYPWSCLLSLISLWSARLHACNEMAETVMALEGLALGAAQPARSTDAASRSDGRDAE